MGDAGFSLRSKNFFTINTIELVQARVPEDFIEQVTALNDILRRDVEKKFRYFRIPKSSGGTRQIEAPEDDYKLQLRDITDLIVNGLKCLPHNACYAYTRGRCVKDAMVYHQENKARWFLKMDIKDFFPSITKEVITTLLPRVFPFNHMDNNTLSELAEVAVNHEGVLPQGSPLSPLLSNLLMVEFDHQLTIKLQYLNRDKYYYTRYADDILISSPYTFRFSELVEAVNETLKVCDLPLKVNNRKTRYQSFSGSNWNLGLMYNNQRNITIGNKKKKEYGFLLDLFLKTFGTSEQWAYTDTTSLVGKLSYLKNIEPMYYKRMIKKYEVKYNKNYQHAVKVVLG